MKRMIPFFLIIFFAAGVFAQVGTITVTVASSEPGTGLTTINYEFTGIEGRTYTLTVEVKFDDDDYVPIPEDHLSGDYPGVSGTGTTFSGTIVWDGAESFPDHYHEQTRVRITAQHFISGDGVTDIDGNEYQTVIIDGREWMAENLRVTRYNNEDYITTGLSNGDWASTVSGTYAIYPHGSITGLGSDTEVVAAYGRLYNWYAVNDSRGICPTGWHVPSDADWTALVDYVVSQGFPDSDVTNGAGNALKSCRQVGSPLSGDCDTSEHPRWDSDGIHSGFDEFGFSALPGGYRNADGSFGSLGTDGDWWSSTEDSSTFAWYRYMGHGYGNVYRYLGNKALGFSLRCVRDLD